MELLERDSHLDLLTSHLGRAASGEGRVVLIGGEAGVGKSALVEAFSRQAAALGAVLRTTCDSLSTPGPLGPVRDLAPALGLRLDQPGGDGEARERLFRAVLETFDTRPDPTIIVAEDAHWADGASLELFRFLGRRIGDRNVLIVVTYRDDEIGANHPLRLLLGDLATASAVHRMSLQPLSAAAVEQIAAGSGRDAAALHRLTGGNPFFLTEVLTAEGEAVPASVSDAILARAARLSPEARAVLDLAAVMGAAIDLDLLLTVAGPVFDEIDEAISGGLLRGTGDDLAFRHDLVREAILAAISAPRRRLLHGRVLTSLRVDPTAEPELARLAHHAEAAGNREAVLEFAIAAAEQATALHAHREAASQYARALRFADTLAAPERGRLLQSRSVACYLSGQGEEAIAAVLAALDLWRKEADPLKEGESLRWLSRFYWFQGQGDEAESAAAAALNLLQPLSPGPELAMTYSTLAQLRMLASDLEATQRWGDRAISLAEQLGETEILVHALTNVGTVQFQHEIVTGEEMLQRSLRLAIEHGFVDHAARALVCLAYASQFVTRLSDAEHWLETGIAYAIEHDLDFYRWYLLATRGLVQVRRGDWDAAEAELRPLLLQPGLATVSRIVALAALGLLDVRRGNPEAVANLDEALALADRTGQLQRLSPVRFARAEAALLRGDTSLAREEARAIQDLVLTRGNRWQRGEFAWLLWQAGDRDVPTEELAAPFALLLGGDFAGAADVWHQLGCPYEEAAALAASDDPDLVRRAVGIFEQLGAKPALSAAIRRLRSLGVSDLPVPRRGPHASTRSHPAGLTRREAEVLALIALGLRNAEIAERLFLTPKTVRHHVTAIYAKLGVANRVEAAQAASQLGLHVPS